MNQLSNQQILELKEYQQLVHQKRRFLIRSVIFFLSFYFMLPLCIAFFPEFMNQSLFHLFTFAWGFALAQFLMVWLLGWMYFRRSKHFDNLVDKIKSERSRL
jgi:uncharacterized membrane protein (DUF485 family)